MKTFDVHQHQIQGYEAVKQGFCYPAFCFTWTWAFTKKLWLQAVVGLMITAGRTGSSKRTFGALFGLLCLFQTELPAQTSSNDVPSPGASWRIELDTLGEVRVPADRLWGAQTERARQNFQIGMPTFVWSRSVIHAMGLVKLCAAEANRELALFDGGPGALSRDLVDAMITAAREVSEGKWDGEFPLAAFQTGSGTQTHMNANEVIANRATQIARGTLKGARPIHPNDHVNKGQSSNDVFPTVMHVATVTELQRTLLPAVRALRDTFANQATKYAEVVMVGRTHLQDATPLTLGQLMSGYVAQLDEACAAVEFSLPALYQLAIGGTAVGTGMNAHPRFGEYVARGLAEATGRPFVSATNKFAALSGHEPMVEASAGLRTLAGVLLKIANDVRWYASGPRAGIGELEIPSNEPGSSIMPGKVNPTQCEALAMVALQVYGNDQTVAIAGSQGNFQLNAYKPLILFNVLESVALLSEGCDSFRKHCAAGIRPNLPTIQEHLTNSLMLVTALAGEIGYDRAAAIAKRAHREGTSVREAALHENVPAESFDRCINAALQTIKEESRLQLGGSSHGAEP